MSGSWADPLRHVAKPAARVVRPPMRAIAAAWYEPGVPWPTGSPPWPDDVASHDTSEAPASTHLPSGYTWLARGLRGYRITAGDALVDYGCGKGRVVLRAARLPFGRVIGVEYSEGLAAMARANVAAVADRLRSPDVSIVNTDAATWPLPDEVTYVYMYNPFPGAVMEPVVSSILASVARRPRRVVVVYANPLERDVLLASGRFRQVARTRGMRPDVPSEAIEVYETHPPAGP